MRLKYAQKMTAIQTILSSLLPIHTMSSHIGLGHYLSAPSKASLLVSDFLLLLLLIPSPRPSPRSARSSSLSLSSRTKSPSFTNTDPLGTAVCPPVATFSNSSMLCPKFPQTEIIVKELAVGALSKLNSSSVNHLGSRYVRIGISNKIIIGMPTAAMVWVMAKVAPNPTSWIATKSQIAGEYASTAPH